MEKKYIFRVESNTFRTIPPILFSMILFSVSHKDQSLDNSYLIDCEFDEWRRVSHALIIHIENQWYNSRQMIRLWPACHYIFLPGRISDVGRLEGKMNDGEGLEILCELLNYVGTNQRSRNQVGVYELDLYTPTWFLVLDLLTYN